MVLFILILGYLAACGKSPTNAPALSPENTEWKLVKLGGQVVSTLPDGKAPQLLLNSQDNKVAGNGGCNLFRGSYQLKDQSLTFQGILSTKMACPDLQTETDFFKALDSSKTWKMEGRTLKLLDGGGTSLAEFEPK